MSAADPRRALPSVDRLLSRPAADEAAERWGREPLAAAIRAELAALREAAAEAAADGADGAAGEAATLDAPGAASPPDDDAILRRATGRLAREARPGLHGVLNGTGVVLHTNLGRAPLSDEAVEALAALGPAYSNLEYDVEAGSRGDRYGHCADLLRRVIDAEAALVVNNNAAAVVLIVNEFARARDVLVSRGELVEIGGSFRIPEMIERAGARLVEVGATNRTRIVDYRRALSDRTGLLLKVHPANFRIEGFTESASMEELAELAREAGVPLAWDLGSAAPPGVLPERLAGPSPSGAAAKLADVVSWSGDKLFGGPQAGIVHGRGDAIARLRRNPLLRAFRVDKLTLAALEATLRAWLDPELARERLPAIQRLVEPAETVRERAALARDMLAPAVRQRIEIVELASLVGAGSAPEQEIASAGWAVDGPATRIDALCRRDRPPLVGRIEDGRYLLDFRCLDCGDADLAASRVAAVLGELGVPEEDPTP